MLPTWSTTAARRPPEALAVHTAIPGLSAVTGAGPEGVSISVDAARQMGQMSRYGVRETTMIEPKRSMVPLVINDVLPAPWLTA